MGWIQKTLSKFSRKRVSTGYITIVYAAGGKPVVVHDSLTPNPRTPQAVQAAGAMTEVLDDETDFEIGEPWIINPATGLPMWSDMFDISGNAFGFDNGFASGHGITNDCADSFGSFDFD